jgi:hypothetical protein
MNVNNVTNIEIKLKTYKGSKNLETNLQHTILAFIDDLETEFSQHD